MLKAVLFFFFLTSRVGMCIQVKKANNDKKYQESEIKLQLNLKSKVSRKQERRGKMQYLALGLGFFNSVHPRPDSSRLTIQKQDCHLQCYPFWTSIDYALIFDLKKKKSTHAYIVLRLKEKLRGKSKDANFFSVYLNQIKKIQTNPKETS